VDAAIVDAQGHSAAAGAIGEIVVKSRYLALGYWRDPALTAARFAVENDARTYRTGDLGRNARGRLPRIPRPRDRALRIHGQQVDPVAIEQALVALDLVGDAVVVGRERGDGDLSLVAFVVIDAAMTGRPTRAQLRAALPAGLRDGALPIAFVLREALPLTAFGKVDRAALAALANSVDLAPEGGDATTSEDALEASIARIWCESLGRASVASDVSFLDYGGDSLNAMSILSRVREHLAADLDVREFFATPTVADQARLVAAVRASARARAPTTWNASASTTSAHTITGRTAYRAPSTA
jgi:acyl carrier protein